MIRKGYVDGRWGQVHYRTVGAGDAPPLVCLHATAYSGRTFTPLMNALATHRNVVAFDTPGYGESDGPAEPQPFERYAEALLESIRALYDERPVDILGFHTGALLAIDMASAWPERIRRLVMIGIPYFNHADRPAWRAKLVHRTTLTEDFGQFAARWTYFVTERSKGLSLERAFECFVDELKVYPREWWAHASLFDYPAVDRLPNVTQRSLVINPTGALADASRRAARLMPNAEVVEMPTLSGAIFDVGTDALRVEIDRFLVAP